MGKIIGIDLGTTNCCVAVLEGGTVQIVPNKEGGRTTPSVVGFTDKGERLVGQIAKRQAVTNASNTVYAVKRLIGRKFDSPETQRMRETAPFEIVDSQNGDARIRVQGRVYSPPELSGIVLQRLKTAAEDFLGEPVADAIITVPAYFDDTQRQATKDAGKIAGLNVERIINEPTAAALAYGLGKTKSEKIAVYDLGGGTFDISILELNNGVFEVKSTNGDTFLGGEDFDQRLVDYLAKRFMEANNGLDLRKDRMALQPLKESADHEKNTTIPCKKGQVFSTAVDNQPLVSVHVLQGEREMAADNKTLSRFELVGIPPAPRGVPQIEVSFDIDANGIVHVGAKDLGTGKQQSIRIVASSGLTEQEIQKMIADAEQHKSSDKKKKELADAKNSADGLTYTTEKALEEYSTLLPAKDMAEIRGDLEALKAVVGSEALPRIKAAVQRLEGSAYRIADALYSSADAGEKKTAAKS